MCMYCDERVTQEEGPMNPIFECNIWIGPIVPRVPFAVSICRIDENRAVAEYYLGDSQVATHYINFCPICGRSLKGDSENV